jgi:hypothetical protein
VKSWAEQFPHPDRRKHSYSGWNGRIIPRWSPGRVNAGESEVIRMWSNGYSMNSNPRESVFQAEELCDRLLADKCARWRSYGAVSDRHFCDANGPQSLRKSAKNREKFKSGRTNLNRGITPAACRKCRIQTPQWPLTGGRSCWKTIASSTDLSRRPDNRSP